MLLCEALEPPGKTKPQLSNHRTRRQGKGVRELKKRKQLQKGPWAVSSPSKLCELADP